MYEKTLVFLERLCGVIWGMPTVLLLVATGIYLSFKLDFFQFKHIDLWLKNTLFKLFNRSFKSDDNGISSFRALCTSLASTIGTGNIAGVATAISFGGPGAVFWMWVSAILGMITSYSENVLGIYYRKKNSNGLWNGGPMIYIKEGLGNKKLFSGFSSQISRFYAIFMMCASLGIGNIVQSNSISDSLKTTLNITPVISGIITTVITLLIIKGGLNSIGNATEKLVPFMSLFYISVTFFILISNLKNSSYVFTSIFKSAFSVNSTIGAVSGLAIKKCISTGFKRGVFSNEAGLGASVTVNSCTNIKEPCEQGMWGIFGVFTDTLIICTLTAFVLLSSTVEAYNINYAMNNPTNDAKYVYIGSEDTKDKIKTYITDTVENRVPEIVFNNGYADIIYTDKTTYTNIMKITYKYNENGTISNIKLDEINGVSLVTVAFKEKFGITASVILSISIVLFALSTILGWYFYGEKAVEYLFIKNKIKEFRLIFVFCCFVGSVVKLTLVWTVADMFNGLMAIPNLVAIIALSDKIKAITENYLKRKNTDNILPIISAYASSQLDTNSEL